MDRKKVLIILGVMIILAFSLGFYLGYSPQNVDREPTAYELLERIK